MLLRINCLIQRNFQQICCKSHCSNKHYRWLCIFNKLIHNRAVFPNSIICAYNLVLEFSSKWQNIGLHKVPISTNFHSAHYKEDSVGRIKKKLIRFFISLPSVWRKWNYCLRRCWVVFKSPTAPAINPLKCEGDRFLLVDKGKTHSFLPLFFRVCRKIEKLVWVDDVS